MERKDALLLFVLAGAGAYAAWTHWDTICARLGIDDLHPGRLRATELAKNAFTFAPPSPNWIALRDREKNGEITLAKDAWSATEIRDPRYRVTCTWVEDGQQRVHTFTVDVGFAVVTYEGEADANPAPR